MSSDCQHVRELMDSYLSEELSVETNHAVLRHVGECPDCAAELKRRQRLRGLLVQALDVTVDTDRASARIAQTLDREPRPWGRIARVAGVAAALVLAAVAYWTGRPVDAAAFDDSAEDHIACALTYPDDFKYERSRAMRNLVSPFERIAEGVGLSHGAYDVIDAHMCPYKGRNYAHVVIRDNKGETLSVFVERAERGALPSAETRVLAGDTVNVHATTRLGYQVSAVATRDHQIFLVSDQPTDPPEIAQEILRAAVRFIRELEK